MNPIEAARAALSRAMEGSDRTAVTEATPGGGWSSGALGFFDWREAVRKDGSPDA